MQQYTSVDWRSIANSLISLSIRFSKWVQTPCLIDHFGHESAKENKKEKCDSMNFGGLTRSKRDLPPMHYTLKIESFSLLLKTEVVKYESEVFEAEGYTWRLCLYPNGNTKGKGKGFVSLYLQIENTSKLAHRWKVTTEFKLFVFDQINDKYLTVRESDASVKSFHEEKTEWGFDKLLSLETFNDASNGYLFNDCCVFGAEIFVIKPTGKGELLSMVKKPANGSLKWKIEDFSKLDKSSYLSKAFTSGGRSWRIKVYPKGYDDGKGNSLSVYLELVDGGKLPRKKTVWAEYKLRVLDQRHGKHVEEKKSDGSVKRFHEMNTEWGFDQLLSLEKFNDASKGYPVNDGCVFGAEIFVIKPTGKGELLSMVKKPANGSLTWKIEDFSKLDKSSYLSKAFASGGRSWFSKWVGLGSVGACLFIWYNKVQTLCLIDHCGHESAKENKKEKCDSMNSGGLTRSKRDLPPMHYTLKIESFSLLRKTKVEKYESDVFKAGGYTWRLCLYPNGNTKGIGKGFVSLYLQIENTSKLGHRWEVTTEFKLFVRDHINDKYLTVRESDASVKRFNELKTEWGFDQLLSLETFNDASNGYLFNDGCVFGAEIFVIKPTGKGELLSMVKKPANGSLTWKIEDFSKLDKSSYLSKAFTARGRSWRIQVYPKGYGDGKGNSLSVYLELVDGGKLPPKKTVWAEYKLRVLDQRHDKHVEKTKSRWFTSSEHTRGFPKFMSLGDLSEVAKGYVRNDTLIVEAEILTLSVSKLFSY
ncbi:hypothetical protein NC651_031582 [Populus alba x Populus x berolinensis]|nr:hypothetical protein NC651_031582 [Populus alba x Populus x berolinensis]